MASSLSLFSVHQSRVLGLRMLHGSSGIDKMVCDANMMSGRCIAGSSFKKKRRGNVASVGAP
jgi:hypothetical protein